MDLVKFRERAVAPGDDGLIRHDCRQEAGRMCPFDRGRNALRQLDVVRTCDATLLNVHGAVAIQEDRRHGAVAPAARHHPGRQVGFDLG